MMLRVPRPLSLSLARVRFRTSHGRSGNRTALFHPIPFSLRSLISSLSSSPFLPLLSALSLPHGLRALDFVQQRSPLLIRIQFARSRARVANESSSDLGSYVASVVYQYRACFTPLFRKRAISQVRFWPTRNNARATEPLPRKNSMFYFSIFASDASKNTLLSY